MEYKYKFSVIIPIYNVEEYLAETIDSVISQTIGFKDNIQIILVNDGSPDNSEKICLEYKEKYPDNIMYIKQKNAGVSAARNNGINYIEGKYVNFLDSDDKWEKNVFKKAWKMFEEHEEIDIIGVRQKYFEAYDGYPSLDHKFDGDKIIDIFENYDHIQLSVTSGFFRASAIGDIRYDTRVKYSEDSKFINEIIIKKGHLGIISSSLHLYRKRFSENSAIQVKNYKDDWYLVTTELCYKHAFELSKEKYGYVIPYMQYYVAYDYQWRLREPIPDIISEETCKKYLEITRELFSELNDEIMFEQKALDANLRIEYLKFKYGKDIVKDFVFNKERESIYYKNLYTYNLQANRPLTMSILELKNGELLIKGLVNLNLSIEDYDLNLVINGKKRVKIELKETLIGRRKVFNYIYNYNKGFEVKIPIKNVKSLYFEIEYKKGRVKITFNERINSKISPKTRVYYKADGKIIYYRNKELIIKEDNLKNNIYCLFRNLKFNICKRQFKVIAYRFIAWLLKKFKRKEIWIISDRPTVANDNGIALFKYIKSIDDKDIKVYFAIDKISKDYQKVKNIGDVLNYSSFKYRICFLLADKVISSQADPWVNNAFGGRGRYYHDLLKNKYVFLQHGIIKDDLSAWLNHYEKNIKMFVTSAAPEYNSIINGDYGFKEDVVKLTGLPRFDLLNDKREKLIAIMPTWRSNIAGKINNKKGVREYNPNFKNSEYYEFYNNLINDKRLLVAMKKKNYKGIFIVHPSHFENSIDFKENSTIRVEKNMADYKNIFSKASLLISDYSSVPFDFAYLHKPVIYTQFDKENFFKSHIYTKGYFSYEKDGFGPVIYDYEKTVDKIIEYIEKDCQIEKKYENRINKFFKYHDKNNCKRVYEEIKKL